MQINVGTTPGQAAEAIVDVDSFGNALNNIPTYRTGIYDLTPAANATDVFTISGSATKTIKITKLQVTADSASTAGVIDFYCFLRSVANSGGTFTTPASVKYDSNNAAPTATVKAYTANPDTLGAGQFIFGDHYALANAGSSGIPIFPWVEIFGTSVTQPIVLRGVNQSFCFSLNGDTIPTDIELYVSIEWTEE